MADAALDRDILQRIARYRRRRKARLLFLIAPVMLETVALAILPIVWSQVHGGPFFMGLQLGTRADWALWSIFMALTVLPLGFLLMAWTEKVPVAPGPAAGIDPYRDAAASLSIAAGVPAPDVVSLAVPTVNALAFSRSGKWSIGITAAALAARGDAIADGTDRETSAPTHAATRAWISRRAISSPCSARPVPGKAPCCAASTILKRSTAGTFSSTAG